MVYVALAVPLVVIPEAVANALIVSVELTVNGVPLYCLRRTARRSPGLAAIQGVKDGCSGVVSFNDTVCVPR